ncbi:MAG TPA: hypothetical protein VEQ37_11530 [Actinomycetota bacterium]|nr:hypothetical protein [Actinomycetota bacterium]
MDKLDHLGWVVQNFYELGGTKLGIRSTSQTFGAALDEVLSEYRVPPEEGRAYYSVIVADGAGKNGRRSRKFHMLYRGTQAVVRTLHFDTLLKALYAELEHHLFREREDAIFADAALVSLNGTTAVVPVQFLTYFSTPSGASKRTGITLAAEPFVAVEPGSGLVVPIRPRLRLSEGAWHTLAAVVPADGGGDRFSLERPTAVDLVCMIGPAEEPVSPVSRGYVLSQLAMQVFNLPLLGQTVLEGMGQMVEGARCYEIRNGTVNEMVQSLATALRTA